MRERMDTMDERERKEELEMRAMAEREERRAFCVACAAVVRAASGVGLCAHELERATRTSPPSPLSRKERGSRSCAAGEERGSRSCATDVQGSPSPVGEGGRGVRSLPSLRPVGEEPGVRSAIEREKGRQNALARRGGTRGGRGAEMQRLHEALDELEAAMERLRELWWELPARDGMARDGRGE